MEAVGMQLNLDEPQPIGMAALRNAGGNASWSICYQLPLAKPAAYPREPPTSMRCVNAARREALVQLCSCSH